SHEVEGWSTAEGGDRWDGARSAPRESGRLCPNRPPHARRFEALFVASDPGLSSDSPQWLTRGPWRPSGRGSSLPGSVHASRACVFVRETEPADEGSCTCRGRSYRGSSPLGWEPYLSLSCRYRDRWDPPPRPRSRGRTSGTISS